KNYEEALTQYQSIKKLSQIAQIYHNLGLVNQYLNNYDKALSYYQKSVELAETLENKESAAISYQDIGTLYYDIQKYSLAQHYYHKAIEIYRKTNNEERIAAIYQNIGVLHYNWGNLDKSIGFYQKSLNIYEKLKDKRCIAISLSNIGLIYEENKHYNKALIYYEKSLLMFEEVNNKQALTYIFYNLGSIYCNLNNYNKSIEYFEKGLYLSRELKMKDYISYNYEALSGVYEEIGQNKKALNYYRNYVDVKDSIFNDDRFNQIEELEAKFQNAQHQKEIEFLKLNQSLKDSKLQKKEAQNLILIFSSFLAFIIAVILFLFNRSQKRFANKLEREVNVRKKSEEKLSQLTDDLERRVVERTLDIEKTNKKLLFEVDQHKKTMGNLNTAKNKAEEADKIKSSFLANISHEIRSPLNVILGFSQMFEKDSLPLNKRREYINSIREGCNGLTHLIEDIIDFASIESGEAKIDIDDFNPHPIMEFLQDHYTNELLKQNKELIKLNYDNENTENDIIIKTDPIRLKQILSILINNSIKFTDSGRINFGFVHSG
ncbi:MAG: tetratricopeptide repeat protein, partial [Bacteroidales bacterium]|nr:tetratricopeptide repeat protein [Bacteroidales bacterium]